MNLLLSIFDKHRFPSVTRERGKIVCPRCDGLGKLTTHSVPCKVCKGEGEISK